MRLPADVWGVVGRHVEDDCDFARLRLANKAVRRALLREFYRRLWPKIGSRARDSSGIISHCLSFRREFHTSPDITPLIDVVLKERCNAQSSWVLHSVLETGLARFDRRHLPRLMLVLAERPEALEDLLESQDAQVLAEEQLALVAAVEYAAQRGATSSCVILLRHVDRGRFLPAAVFAAASEGHLDVLRLIVVHAQAEELLPSPAQQRARSECFNEALIGAIKAASLPCVAYLLFLAPQAASHRQSLALRRAAWYGHADIVSHLLEQQGVDIHAMDDEAVRHAASLGHADVLRVLLAAGGNAAARDNSPVCQAASRGFVSVVALLVEDERVDVAVRASYPLRMARIFGHTAVEKLIRDRLRRDRAARGDVEEKWDAEEGEEAQETKEEE